MDTKLFELPTDDMAFRRIYGDLLAKEALTMMRDPESIATVFQVHQWGHAPRRNGVRVDAEAK